MTVLDVRIYQEFFRIMEANIVLLTTGQCYVIHAMPRPGIAVPPKVIGEKSWMDHEVFAKDGDKLRIEAFQDIYFFASLRSPWLCTTRCGGRVQLDPRSSNIRGRYWLASPGPQRVDYSTLVASHFRLFYRDSASQGD